MKIKVVLYIFRSNLLLLGLTRL